MAQARGYLEWSQTAELLSLVGAVFGDGKRVEPESLNPFAPSRKPQEEAYMPIEALAAAWVDQRRY